MRTTLLALSSLMLAACAAQPRIDQGAALLRDRLFVLPETLPEAGQGDALSPAMLAFIERGAAVRSSRDSRVDWLANVLTRDGELAVRYDASATRNAAQTFEAKAGNCLSLALMVGAFAKKLDIPFHYQLVYVTDTWSRSGELTLSSTHVNVALGTGSTSGRLPSETGPDESNKLLARRADIVDGIGDLTPVLYVEWRLLNLLVQ